MRVWNLRAVIAQGRSDYVEALDGYYKALSFAQESGDERYVGYVANNLGVLETLIGNNKGAITNFRMVPRRYGTAMRWA